MFESRKRARDEDDLVWQPEVRDHKKLRALPFRTSPTANQTTTIPQFAQFAQSPRRLPPPLLTPALTPVETSEDEGELKNPFRSPPRGKSQQLTLNSTIRIEEPRDFDVEMDCSEPAESPQLWQSVGSSQPSPCTIAPQTLFYNPREVNSGGRIPTPIYGYFSPADKSMDTDLPDNDVPTQQEVAHDLFLRRRRLPTPISEDEAMDDPDGMGGMLGRLEMAPKSAAAPIPFKTNKMWGSGSTPAKGKMSISMGYRADCEKCRLKVPGHYNHWIRS
ncbi:MAG: hypothetical protein LQ339_005509 [Xanthoria mediterranea]|nr:MAG: hypothetical protein LQ339_005509 [Xanthoria mediterranea]